MAHTLAKMSHQPAVETKSKARKAGRMHDEDRDTTHPRIVTELFMAFLRPVGKPVDVSRLWKNTLPGSYRSFRLYIYSENQPSAKHLRVNSTSLKNFEDREKPCLSILRRQQLF